MPDTQGAVPLGQTPPQPSQAVAVPQQAEEVAQEIQYPDGLPRSHHARFRQFLELQAQNQVNESELKNTYGAGLTQASIVGLRFQTFLDMIWPAGTPEGSRARLEHDIRYQEALAAQWDTLRSQVIQARLQQSAQITPQEMAFLQARQQQAPGLFGNGQG